MLFHDYIITLLQTMTGQNSPRANADVRQGPSAQACAPRPDRRQPPGRPSSSAAQPAGPASHHTTAKCHDPRRGHEQDHSGMLLDDLESAASPRRIDLLRHLPSMPGIRGYAVAIVFLRMTRHIWGTGVREGSYRWPRRPGLRAASPTTFDDLMAGTEVWTDRTFLVHGERRVTFAGFRAAAQVAHGRTSQAFGITTGRPGDGLRLQQPRVGRRVMGAVALGRGPRVGEPVVEPVPRSTTPS